MIRRKKRWSKDVWELRRVGMEGWIGDDVKEMCVFFFQAEDGIRGFCLARGLGDVYKRQSKGRPLWCTSQLAPSTYPW